MRRSTRVRVDIPVRLRSLDSNMPFDVASRALVVNAQGCGLQTGMPVPADTRLEVSVEGHVEAGHVLNSTLVDAEKKIWVVGIELDRAGNLWGIPSPPADWANLQSPPPADPSTPPVRVHPFAKKKASQSAAQPSLAQPATPAANADELRGRFEALLEEYRERLRAQAVSDWEQWRTDAS